MRNLKFSLSLFFSFLLVNCGMYTLGGIDVGDAKTIQVDFFPNNASLIEPKLAPLLLKKMQDFAINRTPLEQVSGNGDIHYYGEITDYRIDPIAATSQQTAAQNRLTVTVKTYYANRLKPEDDFEKTFSFYSDFDANQQLVGDVLDLALDQITERLVQDIFHTSLAASKF